MTPPPFRDPARSAARAACRAASAACGAVSMIASSASASRVGLEDRLELRGLAACDDGGVSLPEVAPFQCGGLRVDVDEDRCESRPFAATARAQARAAFPLLEGHSEVGMTAECDVGTLSSERGRKRSWALGCRICRAVDAANRPTQARFACVSCGHESNADVNAALNILWTLDRR